MSLLAAGVIPAAPLLIPDLTGDAVARDEDLRDSVRSVVRRVTGIQRTTGAGLVVVGPAPKTGPQAGSWDLTGFGLSHRGHDSRALSAGLGVAAWFLDDVDYQGPRDYLGVADTASPHECVDLGRQLAGNDVVLLIVGDGSARRDDKAPGYFDPRAHAFDNAAATALSSADPQGLLSLEPELARELLAAGRAPWQVLAGAATGGQFVAEETVLDGRYGVAYLTSVWVPA